MAIHSFHLAEVPRSLGARALMRRESATQSNRAEHFEALSLMTLGAAAITPERLQLQRLAVFAQWADEADLDAYLSQTVLGTHLAAGWHVRLEFVRRWGAVSGLDQLPREVRAMADDEPCVAVTLAHARPSQLRRFFRWGRPVERQVRDHPGQTLALAAVRPPATFSTFTVWETFAQMRAMVTASQHGAAMSERERQDFHYQFTTLRFRPLSEHGTWHGRRGIVPRP